MKCPVDMRPSARRLEATYSTTEVMEHLGCRKTKLHELLALGRKFHGCHPLRGGLWPVFKVSHKNVRITETAIEAHKTHMDRLDRDAVFAAAMRARAQNADVRPAA